MSPDTPAMTDAELADAQIVRDLLLTMSANGHHDRSSFYGEQCSCGGNDWPCPDDAKLQNAASFMGALLAEVKRLREAEGAFAELTEARYERRAHCPECVNSISMTAMAKKIAEKRDAQAKLREACREVDKLRARMAEIGETTVEWGIRTDSTDHAPDSPNFGSDQKAILNYPMDERHARKHSKPWGWQAIYRVVGQWHNADQEANHG